MLQLNESLTDGVLLCSERSEGPRYFVCCLDIRILKWYIGIHHIPYFIYAGIYPKLN